MIGKVQFDEGEVEFVIGEIEEPLDAEEFITKMEKGRDDIYNSEK